MSTARYRPCDFAVEPKAFGRADAIAWKPVDGTPSPGAPMFETPSERAKRQRQMIKGPRDAAARLAAARMQNAYVVRIKKLLAANNMNLTTYARKTGAEYNRLTKVFRGEVIMNFEDLARAEQEFGDVHPFGLPTRRETQ